MSTGRELFALLTLSISLYSYSQTRPGSLRGTTTDARSGETIPFANIVIKDDADNIVKGGTSDFDGKYNINPINPGIYKIECSFTGFATIIINDLLISPNAPTIRDFKLREATQELEEVVISYEAPLIDKTKTSSVTTSDDIVNMAVRDITFVASQAAGVTVDAVGNTNIRGARNEGTVYFIDGVKIRGNVNLPQAAIQQTEVITGGLPAQYGDAVGGVISTTTRGPTGTFFGNAEYLTSILFDDSDFNLLALTLGGPIIKNKKSARPIVSFLLSSEYRYVTESRLVSSPYTYNQFNPDLLKSLQEKPIVIDPTGTNFNYRTELVEKGQLSNINARPNSWDNQLRISGNFQIKTGRNTNLSVGGRWVYSNDKRNSYGNHIFNYNNNLDQIDSDWSTFARFQQQFNNDQESNSLIKNAYYNIQVDYSRTFDKVFNKDFDKDFFHYGHVGKFDIKSERIYGFLSDPDTIRGTSLPLYAYVGDNDTAIIFTPGTSNPILSNYVSEYYRLASDPRYTLNTSDFDFFQSASSPPINGQNPPSVYGLWGNVGVVQSFDFMGVTRANYFESRNNQFRVTASTNFDIKDHSLILGFEYEQRSDRAYTLDATGLWSQMRLLQNRPNEELDFSNPIPIIDEFGVFRDTIDFRYAYDETRSSKFAESIRVKIGLGPYDTRQINIDNMDPETFSLDLFSPNEVINSGGTQYLSYYGYDYTGNLISNQPFITDFFTRTDEKGRFTRPVGAFQPIYIAGYIQDQFTFNDLTFNVGVRVDRFDLNQQVLKDPYILAPFYTVKDIANSPITENNPDIPSSIGKDYAVYVNSFQHDDAVIVGYRDEDQWYNAEGEPITNPGILAAAANGNIKPFLVEPPTAATENEGRTIDPQAFKDYDPQTVVMPRIAFNFPITEEALFIAHYDLLAQRPTTNISRLDPFAYLELLNGDNSEVINNPDLKPQKTTEYELGFKQALTEKSAIKISAFYRELRDLIQTVSYTQAYPITYVAYGNRDFGTVKGFSLEYEMRRINRVKLDANYTLQFADGTGSGTTSGLNLARNGQPNLRYILPLNYDNRHQILVRFDCRFAGGSRYLGPVWWNVNVFENFGINITCNALSGRPFTKRDSPYPITVTNPSQAAQVEGQINASRMPWQVIFDARINKVFNLTKNRSKSLEVYFQILNLLDTKNVIGVYAYTGSPDDDGYLASAEAQASISDQTSSQAYIDLYNRAVNDPFNFSLPRRIRLGIAFNF